MDLLDALKFINRNGSLVDAPCSDDDVVRIFRELHERNWIIRRKGRLMASKLGVESLIRAKSTT